MAAAQKERSAKTAARRKTRGEEELRMHAMAGTRQALADLMAWHGIEEQGEAMTLMIHHLHGLGPAGSAQFLSAPRHEIELTGNVARRLDQFRIGRELRTPSLMLGDDPDDSGVYVIE